MNPSEVIQRLNAQTHWLLAALLQSSLAYITGRSAPDSVRSMRTRIISEPIATASSLPIVKGSVSSAPDVVYSCSPLGRTMSP